MTRTQPGAARLARALAARGFPAFVAPVLRIEPSGAAPPRGCFDLAVFVSANAVRAAAEHGNGAWREIPAVAIGAAGHDALRGLGVVPALPWQGSADSVARILAALRSPPRRTLVVKGEGGRDVVQAWLRGQGRQVAEWNVYRRVAATPDIAGEAIDVIDAASGDGLRAAARLWFAGRRERRVAVLVPSERVAGVACGLGFANVVVTGSASTAAVVDALSRLRDGN